MYTRKLGKIKGVFALLLSLAMLVALLPVFTPTADALASDVRVGGTSIDPDGDYDTGWDWDATTQTLTLDGEYTGGNIYISSNTLVTIAIDGDVEINASSGYGIYTSGPLTITGSGSLIINSNGTGIYADYGSVTIEDITLTITAGSYGIDCYGSVTVNNADVEISSYNLTIWTPNYNITVSAGSTVKLTRASDGEYVSNFIYGKLYNSGIISYWIDASTEVTDTIIDDRTPPPPPAFLNPTDARYSGKGYTAQNIGTYTMNSAGVNDAASFPILISTGQELVDLAAHFDGWVNGALYIKLTQDIDLSGLDYSNGGFEPYDDDDSWWPINLAGEDSYEGGTGSYNRNTALHFNGNGKRVTGLSVTENNYRAGLFGLLVNAEVYDLTIVSPVISSEAKTAGALAGKAQASYIHGVTVTGPAIYVLAIDYGNSTIGGLVGETDFGTVIKESGVAGGSIIVNFDGYFGNDSVFVGGLVGYEYYGVIFNCFSSQVNISVYAGDGMAFAGGLVGLSTVFQTGPNACIFNSYATGKLDVIADTVFAGGLVGMLDDHAVNNYARVAITATSDYEELLYVGQVFGEVADWSGYQIERNYFDSGINGDLPPVGLLLSVLDGIESDEYYNDPVGFTSAEELSNALEGGKSAVEGAREIHRSYDDDRPSDVLSWTSSGNPLLAVSVAYNGGWPVHGYGSTPYNPPPVVTTTYTITSSAGAGGTISPLGATSVNEGGSRSYAIAAGEGYTIADVLVDGVSVGAVSSYAFTNVRANHTISATFAEVVVEVDTPTPTAQVHTITATAGVGGSNTPAGATTVPDGGNQSYAISADEGYRIAAVFVDGVEINIGDYPATYGYEFIDVRADHTISASFISEIGLFDEAVPQGDATPDTSDGSAVGFLLLMFAAAGTVAFGAVRGKRGKSRR
jgi:hypothetical protein